ncbi:MAG: hypothetical protein WDW38_000802 [Sanguina aurantia]
MPPHGQPLDDVSSSASFLTSATLLLTPTHPAPERAWDCPGAHSSPQLGDFLERIPAIEVWFQRASDVVRKMGTGDLDLGIVGYDMFSELAFGDSNLVVVHEALNFGKCHLGLGIPLTGKFANISSLEALKAMPEWTAATPLRVVTGYFNIANRFFKDNGFEHVVLLSADGALEASPAMGSADIIFDLVSTGVTLRENNLKEISGGTVMQSQGILVANKKALMERPGLLHVVHELIERFDGHLKAEQYYSVVANMRGDSAEEVATLLLSAPGAAGPAAQGFSSGSQPGSHSGPRPVAGLHQSGRSDPTAQPGPTISPVFNVDKSTDTGICHGFYAATICVKKKALYASVKVLQKLGGSGVLVMPMTYIFDEEPARWRALLLSLGLDEHSPMVQRD